MKKYFNDTGVCVADMHYMVDISEKIEEIFTNYIERGLYFTINRSRQFGKTTTISLLANYINSKEDYFLIRTSFEGLGDETFTNISTFANHFIQIIAEKFKQNNTELSNFCAKNINSIESFYDLSKFITSLSQKISIKLVIIIDEVDKSSNNQLFLSFLGMLRDKYLLRNEGEDHTFHSIVLAGVHDIKTIKLKLRPDEEQTLNSPWNIASDFEVDLSFHPNEISTMLESYSKETGIKMDKKLISEKLYYYTSGYPYLVSKLCKFVDEKIITQRENRNWTVDDIEESYKMIVNVNYQTTLFDSIFKNIQDNFELHETIKSIVIGGKSLGFNIYDKIIGIGVVYGIFKNNNGSCIIHNRIFEQRLSDYFVARSLRESTVLQPLFNDKYYENEGLNMEFILQRYQSFMKENYSSNDEKFIEREGRLIFLSFLKSIINGKGFEFKEPVVADERRMDIVITFGKNRYVVELKLWRGEEYHKRGLQQLSDYLDIYSLRKGYLLIYDFRKDKKYIAETVKFKDKEIFCVYV